MRQRTFLITFMVVMLLPVLWAPAAFADQADDLFRKGTEYLREGNLAEAIQAFTDVLAINSKHADAYNNRGLAYYEQGQYAPAEADFANAIKYDPTDEKANNNLALV